MIESIEIKNLRGIREGKLEGLTPLTVLVGPNGCGKSTILDALLIAGAGPERLRKFREACKFVAAISPDAATRQPVTLEDAQSIMELVGVHQGRLQEWPRWFYWRGDTSSCSVVARSDHPLVLTVKIKGLSLEASCTFRRSGGPEAIIPDPVWLPATHLIDLGSRGAHSPLHHLYSEAVRQGRSDELIAMVQAMLPGTKRIEILTEGDSPVLHVVYPDRSVPVEFAGDGVHALLRMCMEIARPPGALVLIEEPELHQHPRGIAQSARVIVAAARAGVQVVLSTHSLEFIDSVLAVADEKDLERLSVFRLKLDNGGLISSRLTGKEVAFERNQIEDDLR